MDSPASSPSVSPLFGSQPSTPKSSTLKVKSSKPRTPSATQPRIIPDIPCKVCDDVSSGKHYGISCCDGCAGFFKRAIRNSRQYSYVCKSDPVDKCVVDRIHRNQCRACRLRKCILVGMNRDAVQNERGPRKSSAHYDYVYREPMMGITAPMMHTPMMHPEMFMHPEMLVRPDLMMAPIGFPFHPHVMHIPPMITTELPRLGSPPRYPYTPYDHLNPDNYMSLPYPMMPYPMMPLTPPKVEVTISFDESLRQISESTAKMLFAIVEYVKSQCIGLLLHDQKQLLNASWRELFFINAAEGNLVKTFPIVLEALDSRFQERTQLKKTMMEEANLFEVILKRMATHKITEGEYNSLRAIVLFKPSYCKNPNSPSRAEALPPGVSAVQRYMQANGVDTRNLINFNQVSQMYEKAEMTVMNHIHIERFDSLNDCLNSFKLISTCTIEEMFFRQSLGNTTLISTITNILDPKKR